MLILEFSNYKLSDAVFELKYIQNMKPANKNTRSFPYQ